MRVLFINPSQQNFLNFQTGWTFGVRDVGYYQPLGILYVATYLKQNVRDVEVKVIDAASPDMSYSELESKIEEHNPDIIGISTYTHTFADTLKIVRIAKEINPSVHINLGGHHLSYFAKETLQHQGIDSIIVGEGEIKFSRLVSCLKNGNDIEDINGVFTRRNLTAVEKYDRGDLYLSDISQLPFPERALVKQHRYANMLTLDKKMTTIIASRGCPYNCIFCPQAREAYRERASENVAHEIEYCLKEGYTDFFFAEDIFNTSKKKVMRFCNQIRNRNLGVSWCCKARIHGMDYEVLKNMTDVGCYLISFGVETGTDRGLELLGKGTTTQEIRRVFSWCKELKIQTMAYFMIGHTFEKNRDDIMNNIRFLISLEPDYCNINSVNPTPFTKLFDDGVKKGILSYAPWRRMVLTGEKFIPKNWEEYFTKRELQRIRIISMMKFYFRPSYVIRQIINLGSFKEFLYKLNVVKKIVLSGIMAGIRK